MTDVVGEDDAVAVEPGLARSAAIVTAGSIVARVTGFGRVLAVGAALGTTFLGNSYQTSNLVSNTLFELLAAGLLSSVLVPPFVELIDQGEREAASRLAGALLGAALLVLGVIALAGMLGGSLVMHVLTLEVGDAAVRAKEIALGTFFLWFFLPQLLLYATGAVATALLHGDRRFGAPAVAPAANNVVVMATMAAFWFMRHGHAGGRGIAGLVIPRSQQLVLALGTSAGVVAMTVVTMGAVWRAGLRLLPVFDFADPQLRSVIRAGAWAGGFLAFHQVLVAVTLVLANRVEGGVVAYQIAYAFFLLPHAVLGFPVLTTVYPTLAAAAHRRAWPEFTERLVTALRLIAFVVLPASAVLVALGAPVMRVVRAGAFDAGGGALVARVLAGYAVGLLGYDALHLLTRASYAAGDARTPTIVNGFVAVLGTALMVVGFGVARGGDRVVVLGIAYSVATTVGALVLGVVLRHRLHGRTAVVAPLGRMVLTAVAGGLAAAAVASVVPGTGRAAAAVAVVGGGVAALVVHGGGQWLFRAPELRGLRLRGPQVPA